MCAFGTRGGISLMLRVFVELVFIFLFVFSACFTVCFLHLCRCRWGLLLSSRWSFTSFSCRCLFCFPLLRHFRPKHVPCVSTIDSPVRPFTSCPDLLIEYFLVTVLCGWWPQWPLVVLIASFSGPNSHLCYISPIHTHKYSPWPSTNIRGPHDHVCHVLCILRCVWLVCRLCLRARLACLLACFGGFPSCPNPKH